MTDLRTVAIDYETIQIIEPVGEDLLRQQDNARGLRLLTLVLTWRSLGKRLPRIEPGTTSTDNVIELNGYSRKVVCE